MKMSKIHKSALIAVILFSICCFIRAAELIEKIYAVVNGELITYSELKNTEVEMIKALSQQFTGAELEEKIKELKKNLLSSIIEQKLILSLAKEKNYDTANDLEIIKKDIKQQNNMKSDEELKAAIEGQGLDFQEWEKQLRNMRISNRLIWEEIGSKIKIDNPQIMEYYKQNQQEFTKPREFSLLCIYLDKSKYIAPELLDQKKTEIDTELKTSKFEDIAVKFSELPVSENSNNFTLGSFKEGELDKKLEEAALKSNKGENTSWIETDNGWYILHVLDKKEPELIEYKDVRTNIEDRLREVQQRIKLKDYIEKVKAEGLIKIYEEYIPE